MLPHDVSRLDVLCNRHADAQAGLAANHFQLDESVASSVVKHSNLVRKIQYRVATVIMILPAREHIKTTACAPRRRIQYDGLLQSPSHNIVIDTDRSIHKCSCAYCKTGFRVDDPSMKFWLECPCPVRHVDRPTLSHDRGDLDGGDLVVSPQ